MSEQDLIDFLTATIRKSVVTMLGDASDGFKLNIKKLNADLVSFSEDWLFKNCKSKVLPTGTKYYKNCGLTQYFIIEQPPQVRTLSFSDEFVLPPFTNFHLGMGERAAMHFDSKKYRLALPFVIFVFECPSEPSQISLRNTMVQVFYSNKSIEGLETPLYLPNLPNINGECFICFGKNKNSDAPLGHLDSIAYLINDFWSSNFTGDWPHNYKRYISKGLNLLEWEKKSQENPFFLLESDNLILADSIPTPTYGLILNSRPQHGHGSFGNYDAVSDCMVSMQSTWDDTIRDGLKHLDKELTKEIVSKINDLIKIKTTTEEKLVKPKPSWDDIVKSKMSWGDIDW